MSVPKFPGRKQNEINIQTNVQLSVGKIISSIVWVFCWVIKTIWYIQLLASFSSFWILQISNTCYWNFIPSSLEIEYTFFGKNYAACIEKNMLCMFWQLLYIFSKTIFHSAEMIINSHLDHSNNSVVRNKYWYHFTVIRNLINDYRWPCVPVLLYAHWNWVEELAVMCIVQTEENRH